MVKTLITSAVLTLTTTVSFAQEYDRSKYPYSRSDFGCKSPLHKVINVNNGEAILCKFADLDHRVPLKQAWSAKLSDDKIKKLAIDPNNAVWTSSKINRAKGALSSEGFKKVLKGQSEFDGRRFNKHLRGSIATKQQYGMPLDDLEKQFAYKYKNVRPTKRITKRVAAKPFKEAIDKVAKKYGTKIARKVAIRVGGTAAPGPGWALAGGLIAFDVGWWLFTDECDLCDATKYLYDLMQDKTEIQTVANPVPKLTHEEEYRILSTSFSEIQSELNHVRNLVKTDPWVQQPETKSHKEYLKQLEEELTKRKFL